ncbi:hypothetical protein BH10ACI3_BH10ACI3_21260 [soil metagenome]
MKIQEMRSGILHLTKKMENIRPEETFQMLGIEVPITDFDLGAKLTRDSELEEPRWSVISFDQHEAGGLTYRQAADLMSELDANDIAGLCIVTDEAAARLGDQNSRTTFPKLSFDPR